MCPKCSSVLLVRVPEVYSTTDPRGLGEASGAPRTSQVTSRSLQPDGSLRPKLRPSTSSGATHTPGAGGSPQSRPAHLPARRYGGIGRAVYFFGSFAANVVGVVCIAYAESAPVGAFLLSIGDLACAFALVVNRLKNIGMNGWWSLLMLVPVANIFLGVRCLVCPEGYQDTRKLDTAGKAIAGIVVGVFALLILTLIVAALSRR